MILKYYHQWASNIHCSHRSGYTDLVQPVNGYIPAVTPCRQLAYDTWTAGLPNSGPKMWTNKTRSHRTIIGV